MKANKGKNVKITFTNEEAEVFETLIVALRDMLRPEKEEGYFINDLYLNQEEGDLIKDIFRNI